MKTLLACLAFIIVLPLSAQTISTVEQPPKPIPFDQFGAEAQKQYAGDGISITPTAGGARLRAIMQRIEGEATPEGLWLSSTAEEDAGRVNRFRVRAVELGRTRHMSQIAPTGVVQATKDAAVWLRPGLAEEYTVSSDGVRQDFVVAARPAGAGALAVVLEVAGASAQEAAHGATLTLAATGRRLAYHRLRVNDATGRELAARLEVPATDRLRLVVEDAGAVYPVRIDPTFSDADWVSLNPGQPGTNLTVRAMAVDGSGHLFIGGDFTVTGTVVTSRIARWDGSAWSALGTGVNGSVFTLLVSGGDLYAGGSFTTAGGTSANRIARWNGSAWSALGTGMDGQVNALLVSGGDLYAGGGFTTAGGTSANRIARWNGSSWSALGTGMDSQVYALAVSGGDLYAGGGFITAGGTSANYIARWNGSAWSALGTGMNGQVNALAVIGSDLYAGGAFNTAGGTSASNIARWDGSSWSALGTGMSDSVSALAVSGSDLYAGGTFISAGDVAFTRRIARWDGSAWSALGTGMTGFVNALAVSGSDLYAGGTFTTSGGGITNRVAQWDGSAWSALGTGMNGPVYALLVSGSDLYVGGDFTMVGGVTANRIAKWNGSAWSVLGTGMDNLVYSLIQSGGDLYAAGTFTIAGGVTANRIARWNGSSWSPLGTGMNTSVHTMIVSGGDLYAGGTFVQAGGAPASRIARWNGSSWSPLGSGMDSDVYALAVIGSDLYAGGTFITAGGTSASRIAKWDGSAWSALGTGMDGQVNALAVSGSDLYVGGEFNTAGGVMASRVAKWDGSTWSALGAGVNGPVRALALSGSDLYVGGNFTTAGSTPANRVAKWDGSTWSALGTGMNAIIFALALDQADHLFVGGNFTLAGTTVSPFIAMGDLTSSALPTTTVSSLDRALSSPRGTATVSWQLVFAHAVTGVNAANFALANTGLTAPGGISVTNPNAPNPSTTWTVTASTGTGDGSLGINFVNDDGLSHEVTNVIFTGQVYDIDKTPPTFTSLTRLTPPAQVTSADSLVFRATFGETVLGVDSTDFSLHGTTTATVTHVALVSGSQYDITVSGGDLASFNGSVGLNLAAGQNITDQAGNDLPATEPATDQTYTVDNTGPTVTISSVTGDPAPNAVIPVTVQFSESVTGFDLTDITVAGGSKGSFAAVDGDTYTFDLTPSGPGVTVTADIAANGAQDDAGNNNLAAAQFTRTILDQVSIVATNTVAAEGGAFNALYTFTRGGSVGALTVNFEVDASSTASASDYTLSGGGVTLVGTSGTVTFPDGQTTVQVTLTALAEAPVGGGQVAESFETIRLNVIAVPGSYVAGSPSTAQVSINQNGTVVVNTNDSGFGSLRQAVANANSLPNIAQPILFAGPVFTDAVPDTIVLQSHLLLNSGGICIFGPGAKMLTVQNGAAVGSTSWVFRITSGLIRIHDLTIANGNSTAGGGGVEFGTGEAVFLRCRFLNNRGVTGGAFGSTTTTLTSGPITFHDCEFSGNTATGTTGAAGAIFGARNRMSIFNSTFSGNTVEGGDGNGGAVRLSRHQELMVVGNTFIGNSAAGAASASGVMVVPPGGGTSFLTFENNLVAANVGNTTQPDVMGVFGAPGVMRNNLIGNVGALTDFAGNGNLTGTGAAPLDPLLGPLADNGGSTRTHALLAGSPALDAGSTPPSFSEVQLLLPGELAGGTYTLTFGGQTTPPLAYDASGAAVRSALGALSSVGGIGNVSVSKQELLYFIEFRGTLANADQPLITATGAGGLTPTTQTLLEGGPLAHDQRGSGFTRTNGTVDIGAFEVQAVSALSPEIAVHDGSHSLAPELTDGQVTPVDFGSTAPDIASTRSFTVTNSGDADLLISSITAPAGYTTNGAAATLAPGSTYSFQVSLFSPTTATFAGSLIISSNDTDEPAFDFPITGTIVAPGSDPIVSVGENIAVQGTTGSAVLGGPPGATLYQFIGSPAINSSGVVASAVQIRHADASLHTGMMVGQPLVLIATDAQTAPSLPGVNHFNFGPPVINEAGHITFTGEVRGAGITANVNSRCLFSNTSDGVLKLVARVGTSVGLGSNLKTIGNFSIGGDLVIFLGTLVDNSVVLFGWDANTGLRPLMRNGQSLDANGVARTVKSFNILETGNASSGHGREISVAPTGESLVTLSVTFADGSSGVVVGSFDGTSDTSFGLSYAASNQLADTYAAPPVIPLARWNTFRSPGFDNTGTYYGFISQMVTNTLAGVTSTNNVGVFVDTAPGNLTLQLRENEAANGTSGLVFSDFSDLVLGGGDYEFLVKGQVRGSGVVTNVNDKGLWALHATNGLVLVAREGSEAPGVAGSTFFRLTQIALPGTAQPMFQASMNTGVGGVTAASDTGLWVINEADEVKLAVREGDVLDVGGTPRTVIAITALLNGTTTGGALGRRVFLADGQLTLLLTFSGGIQANARVAVP